MKKSLTVLLLFYMFGLFSQTKIVSTDLEFKRSTIYHQLISKVDDSTDELYVLAADKDNTTLLKYNSALFFTDSLKTKTDKNYPVVIGKSFNHKKNIVFYWATENYKKVMAVTYDFDQRITATIFFDIPFTDENILASFEQNNQLYFLSYQKKDKQLKLYILRGNRYDEKILDFSAFKLNLQGSAPATIAEYLATNPIEIIDNDFFTPLFLAVNKIKIYPLKDKLLITLDPFSLQTQAFEIDWNTFAITEKLFPQPTLTSGAGKSNSFYVQEKLYQFKVNETQLVLAKHDYQGIEPVLSYSVLESEQISFKNSPLYYQNADYQTQEIKNTQKFLKRLNNKSAGISVYEMQGDLLFTVGGTNNVVSYDGLALGALITIGGLMLGGDVPLPDTGFNEVLQNVYFECRFDTEFKSKKLPFSPLAIDFMSGFLQENSAITLQNTIKYKDYFILTYYDSKAKQIILRKFEDGYGL